MSLILDFYCRMFHRSTMWPFRSRYLCPVCHRSYPVLWGKDERQRAVRAFDWLLQRPHKVIGGDCTKVKGPLMIRWFLFRSEHASLMLHCFLRSDINRDCHDHPWTFISLPLTSYIEHLPGGNQQKVRRFIPIFRPAEWQHWVEVTRPRTWTLVLRFRSRREWGFITRDGWVHWKAYDYEEACD